MLTITAATAPGYSFGDVLQALAEGEHELGMAATQAAGALLQWPGRDCPWFVPHPEHCIALGVAAFDGFDLSLRPTHLDRDIALSVQIQFADPFQLYWTTSKGGAEEVQAEDQNVMYHVRLHNVLSAL